MRNFKNVLGIVLAILGVVTLLVYYFTDLMNWNIFGWFSWLLVGIGYWMANSSEDNDSLFKLLVCVAAADGELSPEEGAMLATFAQKLGISNKAASKMIEECFNNPIFKIPDSEDKKKKQLNALIEMAKADGRVDDGELKVIKLVAQKYGFSESYVDQRI